MPHHHSSCPVEVVVPKPRILLGVAHQVKEAVEGGRLVVRHTSADTSSVHAFPWTAVLVCNKQERFFFTSLPRARECAQIPVWGAIALASCPEVGRGLPLEAMPKGRVPWRDLGAISCGQEDCTQACDMGEHSTDEHARSSIPCFFWRSFSPKLPKSAMFWYNFSKKVGQNFQKFQFFVAKKPPSPRYVSKKICAT